MPPLSPELLAVADATKGFLPTDEAAALFDAASDTEVKRLKDEAGLPYSRVVPALDLTP